jgi:signal peptidase I
MFLIQKLTILPSPSDYIKEKDININNNVTVIKDRLDRDFVMYGVENTKSMLPLVNEYSNVIGIKPTTTDEINIGDIVVFKCKHNDLVMHRVIKKEIFNGVIKFYTKGDNIDFEDNDYIEFKDIQLKIVMVVY